MLKMSGKSRQCVQKWQNNFSIFFIFVVSFAFPIVLQVGHLVAEQRDRIFGQIAGGKKVCDVVPGLIDQGLEEEHESAQALDVFGIVFGKRSEKKTLCNTYSKRPKTEHVRISVSALPFGCK